MFEVLIRKYILPCLLTFLVILSVVLCHSTTVQAVVRDGQLDSNFVINPVRVGGSGAVHSLVPLPDGKMLVIGASGSLSGGNTNGISRLNADGSFDSTFNGRASGGVTAAFLLGDGKILITGNFTQYDSVARNRVARLNSDGSLDASFNPNLGTEYVQAVAVQPDGKIILNGVFTSIGGVPRNRLARLNADGSLDLSFEVGGGITGSSVTKGVVQPNGKILLVGAFNSYDGAARPGIVRINSNGSLDTTFVPEIAPGSYTNTIFDLSLLNDGKIYVVGDMESTGTIFRLNPDGSRDNSFNTGYVTTGRIYAVLAQPDGRVMIGGAFGSIFINGAIHLCNQVFRFNYDGSVDTSLNLQAGSSGSQYGVMTLKLQADNKILIGGDFSSINGVTRGGIGRVNLDGSLDNSFVGFLGPFTTIYVFHLLPDGKIYIGGDFNALGTTFKNLLARLNADGSIDNTFDLDSRVKNRITSIAIQPDGKILLGGYSGDSSVGNLANGIWRINPDGSLDTTFNTRIAHSEFVRTIAVQADGKILIGGDFTAVNGISRLKIARLNPDGSLDTSFNPILGAPGVYVRKIALQPDGNILVGGGFASVNGSPIANIARLKPDGSIDSTFNIGSGANNTVSSLLVSPSGKIYVGGNFTFFKGVSRNSLVKLNADGSFDSSFKPVRITSDVNSIVELPNRKVLIGGSVTVFPLGNAPRERIIRLLEDGSIDYSFDVGKLTMTYTSVTVFQIAAQTDGKILAAGYFDNVNGINRWGGIMRLNTFPRPTPANFDYEGDGKSDIAVFRPASGTWYQLYSYFNQFRAIQFGASEDKTVAADFDGDYRTDIAVFRPSAGSWYIQKSSDNSFTAIPFGSSEDIPIARDFDGDGKADVAVFRPSIGTWYLLRSADGFAALQFGQAGDLPVAADYDGDGKADIAVFRPSTGAWHRINSSNRNVLSNSFGTNGDIPTQNDFDGDRKTDIAVFRPSTGYWYLNQSSQGFKAIAFGTNGDKPVPADYDGDDKADIAVFRAGVWYIMYSSTNSFASTNFGLPTDMPINSLSN